jgi:hypothetical protein
LTRADITAVTLFQAVMAMPGPRLKVDRRTGQVDVPTYTDLKLHDLSDGPGDPNREILDQRQPAGSPGLFKENGTFLIKNCVGAPTSRRSGITGNSPLCARLFSRTAVRRRVCAPHTWGSMRTINPASLSF